jgi:hypothetical protein
MQPCLQAALLAIGRIGTNLKLPCLRSLLPIRGCKTKSEPVERLRVIKLVRGSDRVLEPCFEVDTGHLLRGLPELLTRESLFSGITLVSKLHHVIQALGAGRGTADFGVQKKAHNGPFDVVVDRFIARSDARHATRPNVIGSLFERLDEPSGRLLKLVDVR